MSITITLPESLLVYVSKIKQSSSLAPLARKKSRKARTAIDCSERFGRMPLVRRSYSSRYRNPKRCNCSEAYCPREKLIRQRPSPTGYGR